MAALGILAAASADAGSLAEIRERGELAMVCFPRQSTNFVRVDVESGAMPWEGTAAQFQGIDVDLMAAFAAELGVRLTIRPVNKPSYGELIPALLAGQGDVIASSFSITRVREKQVDFSIPYFSTHQIVVVRKDSLIDSVEDLADKIGAASRGSSPVERLRQLGLPENRIHYVAFSREGYLAVAEKEVDFALVEEPSLPALLGEHPGLEVAFRLPGAERYGFAVAPGSDLLEPLNQFLEQRRADGELERIIRRYMPTYRSSQADD